MRSLRLTAALSAWLCLSGRVVPGVDAPPPPQTGTNQHNPFTGMDGLITTVLENNAAQQTDTIDIAKRLRKELEKFCPFYDFATVAYDFNDNVAFTKNKEAYSPLAAGDRDGAITGPEGCDQAGKDPPWDACWEGGSLMRYFIGARDAHGQPLVRTAIVFWWPATEATNVQVPETPAWAAQFLKVKWWDSVGNVHSPLWRTCASEQTTVPVDVTVLASCFTEGYAEFAKQFYSHLKSARPRGFLVAPAQAEYDFSSGHIFKLDKEIRPDLPRGQLSSTNRSKISIKLLFAALI